FKPLVSRLVLRGFGQLHTVVGVLSIDVRLFYHPLNDLDPARGLEHQGLEARRDRGSELDAQRLGARDQLLRIGNVGRRDLRSISDIPATNLLMSTTSR